MVQVAVAVGLHAVHHLVHHAGEQQRHAVLLAGRQRNAQVFFVQADAEARLEVAVEHLLPVRVQDFALRPPMFESVASMAPASPPLTGASSMSTPLPSASWASRRATTGEMVDMSITSPPRRIPAKTPRSPVMTSSTSGESGSIRMT